MRRLITTLCVLAAVALQGCAVLRPDFTDLDVVQLPPGDLVTGKVSISFSVFEDFGRLQYVCNKADKSGDAIGPLQSFGACAISHDEGCAMAFWTTTTYAHIGHEVVHCFAKRASQAKRDALPAHFGGAKP